MREEEIFAKKAKSGYTVCFAEQCPKREQCLRWKVGQHAPVTMGFCSCVNPRCQDAATDRCPHYRTTEKVMMAKGMTRIFTDDMPRRVEKYVRNTLIARYHRTYYFEYRNGSRLIPPAMQREVLRLFRQAGWNEEVKFDSYIEDYEW